MVFRGWNLAGRGMDGEAELAALLREITTCRICIEAPAKTPLPHAPRPVLRPSATARLCIASQAPGTRVHASGVPFTDPSGDRLRDWLGLTQDEFYDTSRLAIVPMGFCFPGQDERGADLPPRGECAPAWRARVFAAMPRLELILLIGQYAQTWHLGRARGASMTETVRRWRGYLDATPALLPLPHPSWRNNHWLKKNPWFEAEVLPELRQRVRQLMD